MLNHALRCAGAGIHAAADASADPLPGRRGRCVPLLCARVLRRPEAHAWAFSRARWAPMAVQALRGSRARSRSGGSATTSPCSRGETRRLRCVFRSLATAPGRCSHQEPGGFATGSEDRAASGYRQTSPRSSFTGGCGTRSRQRASSRTRSCLQNVSHVGLASPVGFSVRRGPRRRVWGISRRTGLECGRSEGNAGRFSAHHSESLCGAVPSGRLTTFPARGPLRRPLRCGDGSGRRYSIRRGSNVSGPRRVLRGTRIGQDTSRRCARGCGRRARTMSNGGSRTTHARNVYRFGDVRVSHPPLYLVISSRQGPSR